MLWVEVDYRKQLLILRLKISMLSVYYIHIYRNQQFLYNVECILKLEIFGLRFYVYLKCHFKKRKKSRFLDFQKT